MPKKRAYWVYLEEGMLKEINHAVTGKRNQMRDATALGSALNRCRMHVDYDGADIVEQVFVLIEGLVLNHPFLDGNKRTALVAAELYCWVNHYALLKDDPDNTLLAVLIEEFVDRREPGELKEFLTMNIVEVEA